MFLAGQVDPTAGQTYILASPTAGIRTFTQKDINGYTSNTQYNPVGSKLDEPTIQRMRDELNAAAGTAPNASQNPATPNSATPGTTGATPIQGAVPVNQQPLAQPNTAQPIDNSVAAVPGTASTAQGSYNLLTKIPPPEQQSAAYAAMLKQYQASLNDKSMSDADRARQYNNLQATAKEDAAKNAATAAQPGQPGAPIPPAPGAPSAASTPPGVPGAATAAPGAAASVPDYGKRGEEILKGRAGKKSDSALQHPQPMKVTTLAQGIKGKSLGDYLKAAEQSMKEGKFTAAFDDYDKAEQIAPNNPLIKLGRATWNWARIITHVPRRTCKTCFLSIPSCLWPNMI